MAAQPLSVDYLLPPGVGRAVRYQHYYVLGLEERARVRVTGAPAALRLVPGGARKLRALMRASRSDGPGHVGRYTTNGGARFAIDARDNHAILADDEETLAWADVYFKANRWPEVEYDAKVRPIVNGNGLIDRARVAELRALRDHSRSLDLVFISRVWGGREHNIRLFEELTRLDVRAELRAIMPHGADPAEDAAFAERLRRVGVPAVTDPIALEDLWRALSSARIVVFRSGMHLCIPWRMIDLLAMGACILFDAPPLPQWPEPLVPEVHYADMGIARPAYGPVDAGEYEKVGAAVRSLLADETRQEALRRGAAQYFDESAAPGRVAEYVLGEVSARA